MAKKKDKGRRDNNLGSLYQNKYGKWIAVADLGVDNNGKRIRKQVYYGDSEEKANQAIASAYKKKKSLVKDAFTTKFCDVMKRWLLYNKKQTVKSRTFETIMLNYNNHIEPKLKNLDMQDVDITVLQNLLRGIKSKEPRRKVKYLLNQFMDYCVVQKYIEYNPVLSIDIKDHNTEDVLEQEEQYKAIKPEYRERFFNALKSNEFLCSLCLTAYYSGLRIGELLGLRWQDIDFENKILNVEHSITRYIEYDDDGNVVSQKTILSDTKTRSSRAKLPMSNALIDELKDWKNKQADKERIKDIDYTSPKSFVFCNEEGKMRTYYGTRKILNEFLKKNNLQNCGIHFHAIRHTFGDVLRENNWSIYDIQKMLRHSKASTTEIYLSMENNPALKLANDIDNVFDNQSIKDDNLLQDTDLEYDYYKEREKERQQRRKKNKDFEM